MKNSLKKKFLDILFEDDENYGKDKDEANVTIDESIITKRKTNKDSTINVKDVLYQNNNSSAFIDLQEKPKNEIVIEKPKKDYEFTSQISPMFGVMNEKKKTYKEVKNTDDTLVNKPDDSHLDIITSPIYGYGPQDEVNYIPSETNYLSSDDEDDYPFSDNEEMNNLMDYVENQDEDDDVDEFYEELQEEENEHGEYMGYYQGDYLNDDQSYEDEQRDIPYYDSNVLNDDMDVEEISLFDIDEDE